eukprot:6064768-Pleurochrysis_carterae.AAC.2
MARTTSAKPSARGSRAHAAYACTRPWTYTHPCLRVCCQHARAGAHAHAARSHAYGACTRACARPAVRARVHTRA